MRKLLASFLLVIALAGNAWAGGSLDVVAANSDRIDMGDVTIFDGLSAVSFSLWLNQDSLSANKGIICKWGNTTAEQCVLLQTATASDEIQFDAQSGGVYPESISTGADMTNGVWYNIIYTYNVSSGARQFYINGTAVTTSAVNNISNLIDATSSLQFGFETDESRAPVDGKYAHFSIWSSVLTASDAVSLANGVRPELVATSSLVGYWPFWDSATQIDLSANGNDGTLTTPDESAEGPAVFYSTLGGQ